MRVVVGIDEVGRGSLAGPVTVAAVAIPIGLRHPRTLGPLRDSKRLTVAKREEWFGYCRVNPRIVFAVAHVSPKRVDILNISRAANLAATRAMKKLMLVKITPRAVFLDGGLFLNGMEKMKPKTVVRGDIKIPAVALASIVAKVRRDRLMARLSKRYPGYDLHIHKGYGTLRHIKMLRTYGPSAVHRLTFLSKTARVS